MKRGGLVLGIFALLVTLAAWMRRKNWRVAALIMAAAALIAPNLGWLIPLLLILAACWAPTEITWRRSARPQPSTTSEEHR